MAADGPHPLSVEEHRELGEELKTACARLRELKELVVGVYGAHSTTALRFSRAIQSLEELRYGMEVQASRDLPGLSVDDIYR